MQAYLGKSTCRPPPSSQVQRRYGHKPFLHPSISVKQGHQTGSKFSIFVYCQLHFYVFFVFFLNK